MSGAPDLLDVRGLVVAYDKKQVLHGVDLAVPPGAIVALVGHNGAGKTTLLRAALGLVPRLAGSVAFDGAPVPAGRVAATVQRGLAFVPQGRSTFRSMSVGDNLALALATRPGREAERLALVHRLFPILRERRASPAGKLSGGQQQMLALSLALLREPRLIMLDEPSTGLAPVLVEEVFRRIVELRDELGISVVVVDQNVRQLLRFADRVSVLKAGRMIFAGRPDEVGDDEALWELF